jgi:peptidyl-prolyl cis-trans isomerase D
MLRGIRKASENWMGRAVMGVVMTLLAGSFAVWGINDIFHGFGHSTLATIGSTEIGIDQFRQTYQEHLQVIGRQLGHPLPPDQASAIGLNRQVLGDMIADAGLDQRAHQMGLGLSDEVVAQHIESDVHLHDVHGNFDRERFQMVLQDMGYSEQRYIAEQRQSVLRGQIVDSISGGITPPQAWLDAINQFQNEQRGIAYVSLGTAQAGDIPAPTDEQLSKYFDERKILFRAPDYRKIDTITVTPAALAQWMQIPDDDIKKAYNEHLSSFTTLERRHIEKMVFPTMADAQAAAGRIKAGTGFSAIATERGLKSNDIDLGEVSKAQMVDPAVADAAFALKEGEVSAPVQAQFGVVLLTVLKIEPQVVQSLADATPQLRNEMALERARTQVAEIHDKIEDDRAGGATLEQAAQKEKLPLVIYNVDRSGRDPDAKPIANLIHAPEIINAGFASDVGVDNDPIDADGGFVWYDVAAITPARDRTLDEVKDQVTQRWRDDEIASRLKTKAADLLDKLKNGTPLDTLAAADGLKIETASDLKRGGSSGDVSAKMTDAIFHTAKDAFGSAVGDNPTQWILFRVTDVKTPKLVASSPQATRIQQAVQHQMSDDAYGQYMEWLEGNLGTSISPSMMAQAMGNGAPGTN